MSESDEILEFYRSGASIADLSYSFDISVYRLKKFLANEPAIQPLGYRWRALYPSGTKE